MLRLFASLFLLLSLIAGFVAVRRNTLPYENERYFDPESGVVYEQQSVEVMFAFAAVFIVAAVGLFVLARQKTR